MNWGVGYNTCDQSHDQTTTCDQSHDQTHNMRSVTRPKPTTCDQSHDHTTHLYRLLLSISIINCPNDSRIHPHILSPSQSCKHFFHLFSFLQHSKWEIFNVIINYWEIAHIMRHGSHYYYTLSHKTPPTFPQNLIHIFNYFPKNWFLFFSHFHLSVPPDQYDRFNLFHLLWRPQCLQS